MHSHGWFRSCHLLTTPNALDSVFLLHRFVAVLVSNTDHMLYNRSMPNLAKGSQCFCFIKRFLHYLKSSQIEPC